MVCVKRERSDDEGEEETRRTDGNSATSSDIKEYIETIIVHSGDEEALTEAMEKLRFAVIWRNEMFHELGGPFVVVVVMKNHIDCKLLQQHGIAILEHVTGCLSRAERRVLVGEIGGIQAILSAMERYPLSDDIQYGSLRALSNLTWHAQNAEIFALETDGITRMIHAMNKFSGSSTIVDKCCDLLSNLSKTEKVRKALRDNNVVTTLAAAADCHKEDKRIQKPVGEVVKKLFE